MRTRALLACVLAACGSSAGSEPKWPVNDDKSPVEADAGGTLPNDDDAEDDDDATDDDAGIPDASGEFEDDAGDASTNGDAGAGGDQLADILADLAELTTCKPSQIEPVGECLNTTCANNDQLASLQCAFEQCIPLAEAVDPKCADCLMAAISQDTLGLLSCIDGAAIIGI